MPAPTETERPCSVLPRLAHARSCQCWLCSADLPLTEQLSAAYKAQYEAEWDDLADELWLESMPAWKREDELARRDAEAA